MANGVTACVVVYPRASTAEFLYISSKHKLTYNLLNLLWVRCVLTRRVDQPANDKSSDFVQCVHSGDSLSIKSVV